MLVDVVIHLRTGTTRIHYEVDPEETAIADGCLTLIDGDRAIGYPLTSILYWETAATIEV